MMMRFSFLLIAITSIGPVALADELDFNRDVRPILSDKCYFCHGPDAENRQADLRLDIREDAIDLIEAGDVLDRIHSEDPDLVMPPPESKLSLTPKDRQTLQKWIEAGAVYDEHWAFRRLPQTVEVPVANRADWPQETLDWFVLARMEAADFQPSPPANPLRWLRRVTLDLTGLPPSPSDVAKFEEEVARHPQDAFVAVVDRLLDSESFGEHMATSWLDVARYADSYGYQSDKLNTQWPYRDWVVRAFNENLPYDDFLTWQLAGDLLPNPTRDQKLATAFNRIHRLNNEGGAVFEEWRIENVADRVHTYGTAVLGLTMECCRCHDHKYDPISMRDYYSLSAFFNSIDESGVYDRTQKVPCPSLLLPTSEQADNLVKAKQAMENAEEAYRQAVRQAKAAYPAWVASHPQDNTIADLSLAIGFDRPFNNAIKEIYHPSQSDRSWASMPELVEVTDCPIAPLESELAADRLADQRNPKRLAMLLDGERGVTTEGIIPFDRWRPFSVVITLRDQKQAAGRAVIAHHTRGTDCGYNGWDLTIDGGHLESRMARVWPGNAMSVRTIEPIPKDQWCQIAVTYDGSSKAEGMRIFFNGERLETETIRDEVKKSANVKVDHGGEFVIGQRFRDRGLNGGLIDDARVYHRSLTSNELRHLATGEPMKISPETYVSGWDESARAALAKLVKAREDFVMAEEVMVEIPIMRETEKPRPAHVLARGQYDAPTNDETLVKRDTFESFAFPFPPGASRDRLGLAQWSTHPDHPLTARVAVNRLWGQFFTDSLVRTPENFGLQGELPTHPELLDWLSRDFVQHGWDVKRLCKMIVLSATYRQDSRGASGKREADPDNRLLARGPANRLAAEQIRDLALHASGLMNKARGGPPVSPYQPGEDLWRESNGMSPAYKQSVGQSLYRRSLYSVWKRTAPLPNMMALDATTREVCTVKRSRTNTPLQALVLLNDVQFVEACRVLAEKVAAESDTDTRIRKAFLSLVGRLPDEKEHQLLSDLLASELAFFEEHPDQAEKFVSLGETHASSELSMSQLASLTVLCQAILNLDATIWKR